MPVEYQIAQKLHGLTSTRANRPHDLTDLQIIAHNSKLDFGKLIRTCTRLFTYRKQQPWPPRLDLHEDWREAYNEWADLDGVRPTLEDAVAWANEFISRIDSAEYRRNLYSITRAACSQLDLNQSKALRLFIPNAIFAKFRIVKRCLPVQIIRRPKLDPIPMNPARTR